MRRVLIGTPLEPLARSLWRRVRPPPPLTKDAQYDVELVEVMRRVLEPTSCCVDAGAHTGRLLAAMVELAPRGQHLAFEPLPACAGVLRERFPGVEVRQQALGDVPGTMPFRAVPGELAEFSGFSRRPWDTYPEDGIDLIDVEVVRLDDVVPADRVVRLLKVDVEGAELPLFEAAERVLRRDRPFIGFENSTDPALIHGYLVDEIGLRLSLLHEWLDGGPPMSRERFLEQALGEHHYFFLAHP
jgi:FkbM family methyltransferase